MLPTDVDSAGFDDVRTSPNDDILANVLEVRKGERVLEIGNSAGLFSVCLAMGGCNVSVINTDAHVAELIKRTAEKNNVKIDVKVSGGFDDAFGEYDTIVLNFPQITEEKTELALISRAIDQTPIFMKKDSRIVVVIPSSVGRKKIMNILSDLIVKKEVTVKAVNGKLRVIEATL